MSIATYLPRVVDAELQRLLESSGAVLIEGPKACGKTASATQVAASEVLLDIDANARQAVTLDPSLVLDGETPRLIDEWQVEPVIWDHVRREVDARRKPGQFILTGSAVPADDATRHTGAMRIQRLRMRPMTLFEVGRSTGTVSFSALLQGENPRSADPGLTIRDLIDEVSVGGWPALRNLNPDAARRALRSYVDEIRRVDIQRVDGKRRDPERVQRVLRSLARHTATYATAATIARDVSDDGTTVKADTVREYVDALVRLMIVEDQPSWAPHLRSRYRLRRAAKRQFVDPSLAVAALNASPESLLNDLEFVGFLFESLAIRDLRIYAQALDARVLQYHDSEDLEVDAIVETGDGRWAAFEIKLGSARVDEGANNLLTFSKRIDQAKCGAPAAMAVVVGGGYGYVRDDGIAVIPLGALGP